MTEYYNIVPWYDTAEWHRIYEKIYYVNTLESKTEALSDLLIWKARCPSLPSGIESTLTLLEVYVQDSKNGEGFSNDQLLRLAYSSAIMRFVNHMLDTETAKGASLYQAAKNLGVPDWIVDLRHDTAHSNNLPSIELLREATVIGLEWLQYNYWNKYKQHVNNYVSGQKQVNRLEEHKIAALMSLCGNLSICANPKCNIRNLADIPDSNMRDSILEDARDFFGNYMDLSDLKTVSVSALINVMNQQSPKLLKSKDIGALVIKTLLGDDSFFLSLGVVGELSTFEFHKRNRFTIHYVLCFEVLLTFLHTNNLLLDFLLELIRITLCNDETRCKLAALWVSEILKALGKSKHCMEKLNMTASDSKSPKKKKEVKQLYHHWFPNERNGVLFLDPSKPIPNELTNINFIQPIITTYNPYLTYFVHDLLNLVEPGLPKQVSERICRLAKIISSEPENFKVPTKVYTVEDLKQNKSFNTEETKYNNSESYEKSYESESQTPASEAQSFRNGIWQLASQENNWSLCPIGQILPIRKNVENDMEIDEADE